MNSVPGQGGAANLLGSLSAQQLAALSGVLGQNAFSQSQLAALTSTSLSSQLNNALASVSQQQPTQPTLPVQNASAVVVESKAATSNGVSGAVPDLTLASLPWPVVSPVMNVPHFDLATYRLVNLDVAPSRDVNGFDLPLADVTTLRFFFNLGVQHSRSLAATQLYQEKLAHVVVSSASPSVAQSAQVSLPQVPQVPGVGILPAEVQVGRTMEQYINQLGIAGPQAQALLRQAQSHHLAQQAQLLAAAASVRLPDRPHPTYGSSILPLHADLLQLASQVPISVSPAVPVGQLIRPPLFSSGNTPSHAAAPSSSTASSMNAHKQIPPHSSAAEQQAYYLQQALSAVASSQNEKSEMDAQVLHQGNAGLHPYVRPTSQEVLKPVAVGGGSQDAAFSPRPPPVDPSPPRTLADASTSIIDSSPSTLVHQQAQTSPPGSSDQCSLDKRDSSHSTSDRPQSAREQSSSASVGARVTPQNSAPATPALTADDVVPVSQTLFQVSEQHFTEAFNASRKRSAPNPIGIAKCDFPSTTISSDEGAKLLPEKSVSTAPVQGVDRKEMDDKPALAPILMMTYLSNCMSNIKSTLNTNGLPVGLDANGRAVDYSSRPIDPIFQQARARMENAREFRELSPPTTLSQASRNSFEEGFSPIGVALPTVSSSQPRPQLSGSIGVNKVVADAVSLEKNEEKEDADPPAEKRSKLSEGD